jgi:predicted transcriptional regulator
MSAVPASEREEVHRLLELVPDEDLPTLRRIVRALAVEPTRVSFEDAPEGEEDFTPEDLAALARAKADIAAGRVLSHEEARRLLLGAD